MYRHWFKAMIGTIGAVLIVWFIWVMLPINYSTLLVLHGQPTQAVPLLQQALKNRPHDPFLRWQTGQTLALAGNLDGAIATLRPLADDPAASPYAVRLLIILLAQQGTATEAVAVWQSHKEHIPRVPATTAAYLLQAMLAQDAAPEPTLTYCLLLDLLDLQANDPNEHLIHATLQAPDFWDSPRGSQLQAALTWLSQPAPTPEHAALATPEPDRAAIAALLELPPEAVGWGDELLPNGSFEQHDALTNFAADWQPWSLRWVAQYIGERSNTAMVVGRTGDAWHGNAAMRIETVWQSPADGREVVRAGIIGPQIDLQPDTSYVLSLIYRTQRNGQSYLYFSQAGRQQVQLAPAAMWQQISVVFATGSDATSVQPMIHLWNDGTIWLDAVSLRPLHLPAGNPHPEQHRVDQRPADK